MKQPTQSHSLEQPMAIEKYKPSVKQSQKTLQKKTEREKKLRQINDKREK